MNPQKSFSQKLKSFRWQAPDHWLKIRTIDAHTEGEPLRIILDGFPELKGDTILERRRYAKEHYDHLRKSLMWEPRGHADMYGCILTPPVSEQADFGVLFTHNEGFSTMCGHGIIGITKVLLETDFLKKEEPLTTVRIDTPAGLVTAFGHVKDGRIRRVTFHNVPSFVLTLDQTVAVEGLGEVRYDIAFGGAFYAFVQAEEIDLALTPENYRRIIELGMKIKHAVMRQTEIRHPFEEDLNFLYGTIFIGPPLSSDADSRNVCVFAEGEVDRSPTGTGVSARMALHYARGELEIGREMVIESIIGSKFSGKAVKALDFGPHRAVIPEVGGTAHITGQHEFLIDPEDPLKNGFILR